MKKYLYSPLALALVLTVIATPTAAVAEVMAVELSAPPATARESVSAVYYQATDDGAKGRIYDGKTAYVFSSVRQPV